MVLHALKRNTFVNKRFRCLSTLGDPPPLVGLKTRRFPDFFYTFPKSVRNFSFKCFWATTRRKRRFYRYGPAAERSIDPIQIKILSHLSLNAVSALFKLKFKVTLKKFKMEDVIFGLTAWPVWADWKLRLPCNPPTPLSSSSHTCAFFIGRRNFVEIYENFRTFVTFQRHTKENLLLVFSLLLRFVNTLDVTCFFPYLMRRMVMIDIMVVCVGKKLNCF